MDLDFTPDQLEFRDQVRTWLDENKPTEPRPRDDAGIREYDLAWQRTQAEGGWAGIAWPTEYGGKGLTLLQQLIWYEEYAARGFPGIDACFVGNSHAGPTLITRATDEQKSFHLPKILGGEVIWCQGFSEPDAGSDLAALRTKAVDRRRAPGGVGAEAVDQLRHRRRLPGTAGAHRQHRQQAQGHHLGDLRHEHAGHRRPPDRDHRGRLGILRGVLRRRPHPAEQRGRRCRRRLVGRDGHAVLRAWHRVHRQPGAVGEDHRGPHRLRPRPRRAGRSQARHRRRRDRATAGPGPRLGGRRCGR